MPGSWRAVCVGCAHPPGPSAEHSGAGVDPPIVPAAGDRGRRPRGGRPDLALRELPRVQAPTQLIVGGDDDVVLELNREALAALRCEKRLDIIPGATHLFEEPGTLETAAARAADWFVTHLRKDAPR